MNKQFKYGQHFLKDETILPIMMTYANVKETDKILEIGPGKGILTKKILQKTKNVTTIELDQDLIHDLKKISELNVIQGNALKQMNQVKFNKIISNIPYSISEPLIKKILTQKIDSVTMITGKKFSQILTNNQKISQLTNVFYDINIIQEIPKSAFDPPPNTTSTLIHLQKKPEKNLTQPQLILKKIILQNDKKLKNALLTTLTQEFKLTKNQAKEHLKKIQKNSFLNKKIFDLSNSETTHLINLINNTIQTKPF